MYFIQNVTVTTTVIRIVDLIVLAFGYMKISFKPITSKTETCSVFTALCLKKNK